MGLTGVVGYLGKQGKQGKQGKESIRILLILTLYLLCIIAGNNKFMCPLDMCIGCINWHVHDYVYIQYAETKDSCS